MAVRSWQTRLSGQRHLARRGERRWSWRAIPHIGLLPGHEMSPLGDVFTVWCGGTASLSPCECKGSSGTSWVRQQAPGAQTGMTRRSPPRSW